MPIRRTQSESDLALPKRRLSTTTTTATTNKKYSKQRAPAFTPAEIASQHAQERIALDRLRSKLHDKLTLRYTHDARTTGLEQMLETARDMPSLEAVRRQHPLDMQTLTGEIEQMADVLWARVREECRTRVELIEDFVEFKEAGGRLSGF